MAFWQLHYTSCERGLSGHSGFQFCAVTPGVAPEVLREVERLTIYEPPRYTRTEEAELGIDEYPVSLIHTHSGFTGGTIIARVVFAGADFSNRSGNYFAHTLVADGAAGAPSVLPVELWDAPFWDSRQGPTADLPALPGLPAPGPVNRAAVASFLSAGSHRAGRLGHLLAAADEALSGGPPILLTDSDSTAVAHWIAAVCYLLGPGLGHELTFTTYSHDPLRSGTHVAGTVNTQGPPRPDVSASFRLYDMARDDAPDAPPHHAAVMLARIGPVTSAAVWDLAARLAAPVGKPLAACFPMLAGAALLLEQRLDEGELDAALAWLESPASLVTTDQAAAAVRSALRRESSDTPSVERQARLVDLALRADCAPSDGSSSRTPSGQNLASAVECAAVEHMLTRLRRDEPLGEVGVLRTAHGRSMAAERCAEQVRQVRPERALDLIGWASAARVPLPEEDVRDVGRGLAATGLETRVVAGNLQRAASEWPALREGMVESLSELPASQRQDVFAGPVGGLFRLEDFASYPASAEEWLIQSVADQRITPVPALVHIVKLRRARGQIPPVDISLTRLLWPHRGWTAAEASQIAASLPAGDLASEPVREQFERILHAIPGPWDEGADSWRTFVLQLSAMSEYILREPQLAAALTLAPAVAQLRDAASGKDDADRVIRRLVQSYNSAGQEVQELLGLQLPPLLLTHSHLGHMLSRCPPFLLWQFARYAYTVLHAEPHDVTAAARLYLAMRELGQAKDGQSANYLERELLAPTVPGWSRGEIAQVAIQVEALSPKGEAAFKLWISRYKRWPRIGRRIRK